jgi:hypothetical protein
MHTSSIAHAITLLGLALAIPNATATVTFQNTGTLSGWTANNANGSANIIEQSTYVYKGTTALRCEVNWVGEGTSNHAEVMKYNAAPNGSDRYYGQVIRLPGDWWVNNRNATYQQFSPEDPSGPWILNWVQNKDLFILIKGVHEKVGTITPGVWTRVVFRLKMTSTGLAEYWTNGTKTLSRTNISMTPPGGSATIRWSCGVYATHWRNATQLDPGEPTNKRIYHDHNRIATSLSEADPASW